MISRVSFVNSAPRLASLTPFCRLICDHLLWPDMQPIVAMPFGSPYHGPMLPLLDRPENAGRAPLPGPRSLGGRGGIRSTRGRPRHATTWARIPTVVARLWGGLNQALPIDARFLGLRRARTGPSRRNALGGSDRDPVRPPPAARGCRRGDRRRWLRSCTTSRPSERRSTCPPRSARPGSSAASTNGEAGWLLAAGSRSGSWNRPASRPPYNWGPSLLDIARGGSASAARPAHKEHR